MKKNVWLINHYATNHLINQGGRHYWFAKYLKRAGYEPVVFSCNVRHNGGGNYYKENPLWQMKKAPDGFPFIVIRSTPYTGNGLSRVRNMAVFAWNLVRSARQYAKQYGKPDVILASSVHPLTVLAGEWIARRMKVPCICEVRDLWPETIFAVNGGNKHSIIARLLYAGEKFMYKRANAIIFTMEGGWQYLVDKEYDSGHGGFARQETVHWICNGIDLVQNKEHERTNIVEDVDLDCSDVFKIIYIGSIRKANGLDKLVACAEFLKDTKARIMIYGDGNEREALEKQCSDKGLANVIFKGYIGRQHVPYILSKSNLTLMNYDSYPSIYKYGGSQNKLFQYLAAGKPVLSNNVIGDYDIIQRYHCGVSKQINSATEYAYEIRKFLNMPDEKYKQMCDNALLAANDFDFQKLTTKLISVIEGVKH